MTIEEAMDIFEMTNKNEITESNVKMIYRKLCFDYHPDAHQNEDVEYYDDMMKKINAAYEILLKYIPNVDYQRKQEQKIENERQEQIAKEKILMDIIVRAYYAAKPEIDKINEDFMDLFLSIPQQVGHISSGVYGKTISGYDHIKQTFIKKAVAESEIMNKYIKNFAIEFAKRHGININFLEVFNGEYINFLNNNRTWYDQYCSNKDKNEPKKLR